MPIRKTHFGTLPDGRSASLFVLTNRNGLLAKITDYGGILVGLETPDRNGRTEDVVLGRDSLEGYLAGHPYFGCLTGRVAGRIGGAEFRLNGKTYPLTANDGPNCLHGGPDGYDKALWEATVNETEDGGKLRLRLTDADGNNGFPGNVDCRVTYALLADDTLEITYEAETDRATPFNITNHAYFNLAGQGNGDVLGHRMRIFADSTARVDAHGTATGHRDAVRAGFNDFREPITLGEWPLGPDNADTHYFLAGGRTAFPKAAAFVHEPTSGRTLEVSTTEPGLQFYAGLQLDAASKNGCHYKALNGFCLETQDYPDSVRFPDRGGAILRPGETFRSATLYKFGVCDTAPRQRACRKSHKATRSMTALGNHAANQKGMARCSPMIVATLTNK